jgi:hypothetical protein
MPLTNEQKKAEESGQDASTKKLQGALYDGVVKSFDYATELYTVAVDDGPEIECQYLSGMFSRLIGVQLKYVLPSGTRVKTVLGPSPCIIGALPGSDPEGVTGAKNNHTVSGESIRTVGGDTSPQSCNIPVDLLEGELDLTNELRVGLQLMLGMARLTAGEQAVVETIAYNDMVRIVSEVFRHHSAFGDEEIYNDGRLNKVEHGTSYDHEAWGTTEGEKLATQDEEGVPTVAAGDAGRWRYSKYMGFLGDFIHIFVTDPTAAAGNMFDSASRAGKARVQIMSDGSLLAQSVSDIVLERVCRVTVPVQKDKWDSPDGNLAKDMESLDSKFVQLWGGLKGSRDRQDLANMAYQLREYARWLNTYHSMSRFLQMDKDWDVPSEASQPTPSWGNQEKSVEQVNAGEDLFYDTYACIRIMRDGSIVVWSGDGSSFVMAGGSVQLHASKNLDLRAAGDIRIHAGRDLHMHARRHVDLLAAVGGLRIKTRCYIEALCEKGSLLVRSLAKDPNLAGYEEETGDADNPAPTVRDNAVSIQAPNGKMSTSSATGHETVVTSKGITLDDAVPTVDILNPYGDITIRSDISGDGGIDIVGSNIRLKAFGDMWIRAFNWTASVIKNFSVVGYGKTKLNVSPSGAVQARHFLADQIDARLSLVSREINIPLLPILGFVGASDRSPTGDVVIPPEDGSVEEANAWALEQPEAVDTSAFEGPEFEYGDYTPPEVHRESLTDQFLRLSTPTDWDGQFGTWTPGIAKGALTTGPYTSTEENAEQHNPSSGVTPLGTPNPVLPKNLPTEASGYGSKATSWKYLKA